MSAEPQGIPLSIGEARLVAKQIRETRILLGPGREYWAWVVEQLCDRLESEREECAKLVEEELPDACTCDDCSTSARGPHPLFDVEKIAAAIRARKP
jgi:hypothetical protein